MSSEVDDAKKASKEHAALKKHLNRRIKTLEEARKRNIAKKKNVDTKFNNMKAELGHKKRTNKAFSTQLNTAKSR